MMIETAGIKPPFSINLRFGLFEGGVVLAVNTVALLGAWHYLPRLKEHASALLLYLILVMGINGMGVILGPIIGPTIAGAVAESYGWRWAFLMLLPVAVAGLAEALAAQWSAAPRIILTGGAAPALLSAWEGHLPTANRVPGDSSSAETAVSQYLQYDEYLVHRGAILCLHLA